MADVLLTHCNHLYSDRKQVEKMRPYPPLQTLLAAAYLRQEGFEVALFDATLSSSPEEGFRSALHLHNPRLVAICEDNFNFLTKMCLERNRDLAFRMTRIVKESSDTPVVINSSDASDRAGEYLARGLDLVIVGELEISLLDIVSHYLHGPNGNISEIRGLVSRDARSGEVRYSAPRQPAKDLSRFPIAAWDLVDVSGYREAWRNAHGFFSLNMVSSRGCPYHCNWCAKPIYGRPTGSLLPNRSPRRCGT